MSEKHLRRRKIGLNIFPEEGWMGGGTLRWTDIKAMAQTAEKIGFDTIWLPDRMTQIRNNQKHGIWESMTMLAGIAAVTERAEIGHATLRSIYRNPTLLARMAEAIDEISGGRFILGIGSGSSAVPPKADNHAFGYPTNYPVSRFEEALQITLGLLRDGRIDFAGRFYQAHDCTIQPRGPRPGGPPVFIAAMGPRMMRIAARHADIWGVPVPARTPASYETFREQFDTACAEVGRDPSSIMKMALVAIDTVTGVRPARNPYGESLSGSPEEMADALIKFFEAGYEHIVLVPYPNSPAAVAACAPILDILHRHG